MFGQQRQKSIHNIKKNNVKCNSRADNTGKSLKKQHQWSKTMHKKIKTAQNCTALWLTQQANVTNKNLLELSKLHMQNMTALNTGFKSLVKKKQILGLYATVYTVQYTHRTSTK